MSSNLALLTQAHTAIAAKRRARKTQIAEIVFDDDARRDFLTGFHKRKLAKAEAARSKAKEREKQEHMEVLREHRRSLREQALENSARVEKAYAELAGHKEEEDNDDDEWSGIADSSAQQPRDAEYEDEQTLATVTVVEDFDPDSLIHGPVPAAPSQSHMPDKRASQSKPKPKPASHTKPRPKKVAYETKAARKTNQLKQRARRTEKAERAGGKASRMKKKSSSKR